MMKRCLILLSLFLAAGFPALAASDRAATEQVAAQLIASVSTVRPGETIWVGLRQKIIPHWHTYWVNPGDSGLPTKISWQLPNGAKAGVIEWPVPSRFDLGAVTNYGYADQVTLLTRITAPAQLEPGGKFEINAKVDWLVCEEICIPQHVELNLALPSVAANAPQSPDDRLIEAARLQLPKPAPWWIRVDNTNTGADNNSLTLRAVGAAKQFAAAQRVEFFADAWGYVEHAAQQSLRVEGDDAIVELTPGEKELGVDESLSGILKVVAADGSVAGYRVGTGLTIPAAAPPQSLPAQTELELAMAMALALLGGIILNLMPCVFPVLSIKALGLFKYGHATPLQNRLHGFAYTGGVLSSFAALAVLLIALKAGGTQIGWGFQYQSPVFVLIVACLMFSVGLSLSGVFALGGSIAGVGSTLAGKPGYIGSFFTGVLAAIVATPCTAPFMGAAIAFALSKPPLQLLAVFLSLGFGLALPYLLLTFWPALQRRLPRPGAWMDRLKQALAFPMYVAAVWLVWVLAQQAGADAIAFALGGMVVIAFAAWLYEFTRHTSTSARRFGTAVSIGAIVIALAASYNGVVNPVVTDADNVQSAANARAGTDWEAYSAQRLQQVRAEGKPVFVNFTAAWCISCLVNERVALKQPAVIDAFAQRGIVYLKGDWTNQDAAISEKLAEFGRSGVPLYLFFPRGASTEPVVLPQILTPEIVLSALGSHAGVAAALSMNNIQSSSQ